MTPYQFIQKWKRNTVKESGSSQEHFIDLCELLGHPTPNDADPDGEWFTFQKLVNKDTGRKGFADVWRRNCFGWEYKGKRKNLADAYRQLCQYRESLGNPPLLVVCDLNDGWIPQCDWFGIRDLGAGVKRESLRRKRRFVEWPGLGLRLGCLRRR